MEHVQQGPPMPPPQTRRTKAAAATSSSSAAATKPTPRPTPAPAPRQTPATEQEEETPVHLPIWEPNGCQGQAAAPADGDEDDAETPGLTPASPNATQSPTEAEPAQAQDAAATSDVAANLPAGPGGAELPSPVNPPWCPASKNSQHSLLPSTGFNDMWSSRASRNGMRGKSCSRSKT